MAVTLPMNEITGVLCSVCRKQPATKLCDFPIGRSRYVGHPPRYQMEQAKKMDTAWKEVRMSWTVTCDKPLCAACAISMNSEIDFCPCHIEEMQKHRSPHKPK